MEYRWRQTGLVFVAADTRHEEWIHRAIFRRENQQPRRATSNGGHLSTDRFGISLQTVFIRPHRDDADLGPQQGLTWRPRSAAFQCLHAGNDGKLRQT